MGTLVLISHQDLPLAVDLRLSVLGMVQNAMKNVVASLH